MTADEMLTPASPQVDRVRFALPPKQYVEEVTRKDLIVLHFTAGSSAGSAFQTWKNDPARVATAYLIDLDGGVYEVFNPKYWAFHLGVKGTSGHDKRSIGIEIANVGPLKRSAQNPEALNWWPKDWQTRFCTLDEQDKFVQRSYRGMHYFAAFPEIQADSVRNLVHKLCDRFEIPKVLADAARRPECDMEFFAKYKGIATHANFRKDKWDIGPAYAWESLGL